MFIAQKRLVVFYLIFSCLTYSLAQSPNANFDENQPNFKYLEHLIKVGIDSVRKSYELNELVNDSILYIAADDHTKYLKNFGRLSHYQQNNTKKRTPQLRAEYFGAKNYNLGENIAYVPYGTYIKIKDDKEFSTSSYKGIADAFVIGWVNSPRHFENIITPDFEITGVNVLLDKEKERIYACQKFAHVNMRFIFEENASFFPYSNYKPEPQIASFDEVPKKLIEKYKYPFGLSHDKLEKCDGCPSRYEESPDVSLQYDKSKGFVLRFEDSDYVKKIIRNKNDGFAIEIVDFEDYACGSPHYYTKPSRRNGQLKLNGKPLEPKYRKDLMKGFKKRKPLPDVKFFPYIFKRNAVNLFRKFGQYKVDKFSSKYFEVRLGKLPKNTPKLFNYNLLIIKDKQICDVYHFNSYCGDYHEEYLETGIIPFYYENFEYEFELVADKMKFTIPFEQGKYDFEKKMVLQNISALSDYDFLIDSVAITAYSSIEGDSATNAQLQIKRSENIASIFQGLQDEKITKSIKSAVDLKGFKKELRKNRELAEKIRLKDIDLIREVNQNPNKYEPELAATRKGEVKVFFHIIPNKKSLDYYLKKEMESLTKRVNLKKRHRQDYEAEIIKIARLYLYTYKMVKKDYLDPTYFQELLLPSFKTEAPELMQYYLLIGSEFTEEFKQIRNWEQDSTRYFKKYKSDVVTDFIPPFNFLLLKVLSEDLINKKSMSKEEYKAFNSRADKLETFYDKDRQAQLYIDKINFNMNMFCLNHYFNNDFQANKRNAYNAISQVYDFYERMGLMTNTLALKLGRLAISYHNFELGVSLVEPYQENNLANKAFVNEANYLHISEPPFSSKPYYDKLIKDSYKMPENIWCNMFIKNCGIPFQAFDYEPLRNRYCEICVGKNDYLNEVYFGN